MIVPGGKHGGKPLEGFKGTVQVDGYSGHNRLRRPDRPGGALTLAACWVHARRGLKEVFDSNASPIAKAGLERMAQLYRIEDRIRGEAPATRQFVRWTESAPLVSAFGVWLDEQRSRVSPRSRLGEKLTYIANQWEGLLVFLYDGRVEMDSNFVENRIRPIKLTAKNALFAGHDEGARSWVERLDRGVAIQDPRLAQQGPYRVVEMVVQPRRALVRRDPLQGAEPNPRSPPCSCPTATD